MKNLALSALVVLALPGAASASTITTSDGSDPAPYAAELARSYMPTPPAFTVQPNPEGCQWGPKPWPLACALSDGRMIVDPARIIAGDNFARIVVTHETGHLVDFAIAAQDGGQLRREYLDLIGAPGADWTGPLPGDARSAMEHFADVWAGCAIDGPNTADAAVVTPDYHFEVPADVYRQACDLIATASTAQGFDPAGATPPASSWRKEPAVGLCLRDGYYTDCQPARPAAEPRRAKAHGWGRLARRWGWGGRRWRVR